MAQFKGSLLRNAVLAAVIVSIVVGASAYAANLAGNQVATTASSSASGSSLGGHTSSTNAYSSSSLKEMTETSTAISPSTSPTSSTTTLAVSQSSISASTASSSSSSSNQPITTSSTNILTSTTSSSSQTFSFGQLVAKISFGNNSAVTSLLYDPINQTLVATVGTTPQAIQSHTVIINTLDQQIVGNLSALSVSSMTFDSRDNLIFGSSPNGASSDGYVNVYNATSLELVKSIPVGLEPGDIFYNSDNGMVYVTVQGFFGTPTTDLDDIQVISTQTLSVVKNITVGYSPGSLAYDPQNGYLYVANEGTTMFTNGNSVSNQSIAVIDTATNQLVTTIKNTSGDIPGGMIYSPVNQQLYVEQTIFAYGGSNQIVVINATDTSVIGTIIPVPDDATSAYHFGEMAYDPANGYIFIETYNQSSTSNSGTYSIAVFDSHSNSIVGWINLPPGASGVQALSYANGYLYVSTTLPPFQRYSENGVVLVYAVP